MIVNEDETGNFPLTYEICKFLGKQGRVWDVKRSLGSGRGGRHVLFCPAANAENADSREARTRNRRVFRTDLSSPPVNINDQSSAE